MDNKQFSPPVIDPIVGEIVHGISFSEAIKELTNGKKIARIEWNNTDYGLLKDGWLSIFRNGEFFIWKVNDGDLLATDWIILNN